jgi:hypothetical protein
MMTKMAEQMWGAAVSLSPGYLIDKFLDWLEELNVAMALHPVGGFANSETSTEAILDSLDA